LFIDTANITDVTLDEQKHQQRETGEPFPRDAVDDIMTQDQAKYREQLLAALSSSFGASEQAAGEPFEEHVCALAGVSQQDLYQEFGTFRELVSAWFAERAFEAGVAASELPDAATAGFAERLEAFCFVLLDVLDQYPGVTDRIFRKYATGFFGRFRDATMEVLTRVADAPDVPGVNRLVVATSVGRYVLAEAVIRLIDASLTDDSVDRQKSAALIDRTVALVAEVSTDRVPQQLIELARYGYESGYLSLRRIPLFGSFFGNPDESR
jgi:hypothetical protein